MKKITTALLIITFMFLTFLPVKAANNTEYTTIEYLDNGDYFETKLIVKSSLTRATLSGSKTTSYKNASGSTMWSVTVNGTFSYTAGKSSSCTSVSGSAESYVSNWKVSYNTSRSGNKATCTGTGKHYSGSSLVGTYTKSVTLTCDKYGNLT